jgi:glycine hydroxymethyltransferase
MHLDHGGHLTHGAKVSCVGQLYNIVSYGVTRKYETIDYKSINKLASIHKPKIIVAGASAYPRVINFKAFSKIAKRHGALLMVDMSHISGLIAAKLHTSPFPFADIVTSTTHKTLRGPRGGIILCKKEFKDAIDKSVFPGLQGGPLMNNVLSKAICFKEAMSSSFISYQKQVIKNSKVLAMTLKREGFKLVSNGTDNHLMLVKVDHLDLNGKECQDKLEKIDIFVNKNKIPFDKKTALTTSGIRLGTAAVTSLGMKERDIERIGKIISDCLLNRVDSSVLKAKVHAISKTFISKSW